MNNLLLVFEYVASSFTFFMVSLIGVMLLGYTIVATMSQASKQQDDMEQLALKFCHKK